MKETITVYEMFQWSADLQKTIGFSNSECEQWLSDNYDITREQWREYNHTLGLARGDISWVVYLGNLNEEIESDAVTSPAAFELLFPSKLKKPASKKSQPEKSARKKRGFGR